jgi:TolA-binding protein
MVVFIAVFMAVSPSLAQSELELFQNRINALEEGLKDVRGILEEDFHALKRSVESNGSVAPEGAVQLENRITILIDQIDALNNRIERTLEVVNSNEIRLLQLEKRLDRLGGAGVEGEAVEGEAASADSPSGPAANTGVGDVPVTSLRSSSNDDSTWTISADDLNEELANLPKPEDATALDAEETEAEESDSLASSSSDPSVLSGVDPDEQYLFAREKAKQNNLNAAELAFAEFIERNPDHDRLSDATFWLGRVQFMQSSYEQAAITFTQFNTLWPTDTRREKTTLLIAESVSHFAQPNEVCDLLSSLPNLIEDPTPNFYNQLDKLKQKSECTS